MPFGMLQVQRYSSYLRRVWSQKGADALTWEGHVQPCAQIEDFTDPALRAQGDINTWSRSVSIAGVAAQQPIVQLLPPTTVQGDRLFVIEGIIIFSTIASEWTWGLGAADASGTLSSLNGRQNSQPSVGAFLSNGALAAVTQVSGGRVSLPALGMIVLGPPFFPVMQESRTGLSVFKVIGVAQNNTAIVTVCGYDRAQAESEL
jgi:hypothetical protein